MSVTEVGINGNPCGKGKVWVEIVGSDMRGKGAFHDGPEFDVFATVSETGAIGPGMAVATQNAAIFRGNISEGGLSGEWENVMQCRGTWTVVRE